MKKERLQYTMQKYKGLYYYEQLYGNMTWKKWILRKVQFYNTEPGRNRNYEQPNCKY